MKALFIDSSGEELFVMAFSDEKVAVRKGKGNSKKHNSTLLPYVDQVLTEIGEDIKHIENIVCVVGPGSFTGIRLGVSAANALAFAGGCKRYSMNALEIIAYNEDSKTLSLIDAMHGNYYGGEFISGKEIKLGNYTQDDVNSFDGKVIIWDGKHDEDKILLCVKEKLKSGLSTDILSPVYLKKSQAEREYEERNNV